MTSNTSNTTTQSALHRLLHSPNFDHDLICNLACAWSLPTHPTFERKTELIKAAIDDAIASPLGVYPPASQVSYFMRKIREVVRERIELYRLQVQEDSLAIVESTSSEEAPVDDSELPSLID